MHAKDLPAEMTTGQQHIERLSVCLDHAEKESPLVSWQGDKGLGDLGNKPCLMHLLIPSVRCAGERAGKQGAASCPGKNTSKLQSNVHRMLLCHSIKQNSEHICAWVCLCSQKTRRKKTKEIRRLLCHGTNEALLCAESWINCLCTLMHSSVCGSRYQL